MADLQWVKLQKSLIKEASDASLYDDIITCYENGLYRPGFILTWLLLIESLKRKLLELESIGNTKALAENQKIQKLEASHKSVDVEIYNAAKVCEIITDSEFTIIDSLWQQRCVFSHPYMANVTIKDFEYIIEKLINISYLKPILMTKDMINDYINNLKTYPHTLPMNVSAKTPLIRDKIKLVSEKHYPFLYKTLQFELSKEVAANGWRSNLSTTFRCFIYILLNEFVIDINDKKMGVESHLIRNPEICWLYFFLVDLWNKLDLKYKDMLIEFFNNTELKSLDYVLYNVKNLMKSESNPRYLKIYYNKIKHLDLTSDILSFYYDKEKLVNDITDRYIDGNIFTMQGVFVDFLISIDNIHSYFSPMQCYKLGTLLARCFENGTFKAQIFINETNNRAKIGEDFLKGFIDQLMISNDMAPKLNINNLSLILNIMSKLSDECTNEILVHISSIYSGKRENPIYWEYRDKSNSLLSKSLPMFTNLQVFKKISTIIQEYYQDCHN